jgi:hypothetical protein
MMGNSTFGAQFVQSSEEGFMATPYEDILRHIESLSPADQLRLISDLAERLRTQGQSKSRTSILELQGLGKEVWQGLDAQEYVDRERASWNG